jgi:hypothetical protein
MSKNKWTSLKKPENNQVNTNARKFKSNDDFFKSRDKRIANAKRSGLSSLAQAIYLLGLARLCNAEKVARRSHNMLGFKIRT